MARMCDRCGVDDRPYCGECREYEGRIAGLEAQNATLDSLHGKAIERQTELEAENKALIEGLQTFVKRRTIRQRKAIQRLLQRLRLNRSDDF